MPYAVMISSLLSCYIDLIMTLRIYVNFQSAGKVQKNDEDPHNEDAATDK